MSTTNIINTKHDDYIHDIEINANGTKMAICSSDHNISIYHKTEQNEWEYEISWEAHSSPVIKIAWCPIQHGFIIASCGLDKVLSVWEDQISGKQWVKRYTTDLNCIISDIEFYPSNEIILLAASTRDGYIHFYKCDKNLTSWNHVSEVSISKSEINSISWCRSKNDKKYIVVGSKDHLYIYEFGGNIKKCIETLPIIDVAYAPTIGRLYHRIASCSDYKISIYKYYDDNLDKITDIDLDSIPLKLQWNVLGNILYVSCNDKTIKIFKQDIDGKFYQFDKIIQNS